LVIHSKGFRFHIKTNKAGSRIVDSFVVFNEASIFLAPLISDNQIQKRSIPIIGVLLLTNGVDIK